MQYLISKNALAATSATTFAVQVLSAITSTMIVAAVPLQAPPPVHPVKWKPVAAVAVT
jgi:hypothetical protein